MSSEAIMARRISQGALTLEETLQYGISLAKAIKSSHERGKTLGVLHPARIELNGTAARLLESEMPADATAYLSPEQLRGETPDVRSDIFAFGAILQEMLTGARAFPAVNAGELKTSILEAAPAPLDGVRPELKGLIGRCLAKDPAQRWQRAGALVIELKLVSAALRHAQQVAGWKEQLAAIRSEIGFLDQKLSSEKAAQSHALGEVSKRVEETRQEIEHQGAKAAAAALAMTTVQQRVAGVERTVSVHAGAIESVENALAQTDEVIEHVVDAFDSMRAETHSAKKNGLSE